MGSTKGSTKADDGVKAKAPRGGGYFLFFRENMKKWQEEREQAKAKKGKKPLVSQIAGKHWKELDAKEKAKWTEKAQKQASGSTKKTASVTKKTASVTKK